MMTARNKRIVFQGFALALEEMEVKMGSRGWHSYQVIRHPGGVGVLPVHDDGKVSLVRQLRPALATSLLELPAGRLKPGEDPSICGLRELAEETGLIAGRLDSLGSVHPSPGVSDEITHLFVATELTQGSAFPESYEDIEVVTIPLEDAVQMAMNGSISDGKTTIALFRAAARRKNHNP